MNSPLTAEEFGLLKLINTPTLANAIERIGVRDRLEGFTRGNIRAVYPDLGVMLGHAVTVTIRSARKPARPADLKAYWDYIQSIPAPRVVVARDLDQPAAGAWWGEVNANIHRALGCVGVVTDGAVRDLDEVRPMGFHFFAAGLAVSHGWAFPESFGEPVTVDGMSVKPGELVHADKHGALVIPAGQERATIEAAAAVEQFERPIIQLCKSSEFSTARLNQLLNASRHFATNSPHSSGQ